jgi:hypothetical protein
MLAPCRSYGSLLLPVGLGLGLYIDNLQVSSLLAIACRLATYRSFGALSWLVGVGLGLYVGNVQFFWGLVMARWSGFGVVRRQPTVLLGPCYGLLEWL